MKLNIKELRDRNGLTQEQLAEAMRMGIDNLRRVEANKGVSVNKAQIDRFCAVLKCRVDELITVEKIKIND
jgi:transcriptional regulator with XRE-family HTH domain